MQAWENFLALQEKELGAETVRKWLRPLQVLRFDACNLYLQAKDSFQISWFEEHVRQKALQKFVNNNNKRIKIHLTTGQTVDEQNVKSKKQKEIKASSTPSFPFSFPALDPHCTFENFVKNESNELLCSILKDITNPKEKAKNKTELGAFNPIFIHGSAGSGKTHLMIATAYALQKNGLKAIYTHADTFTEHVVAAIRSGTMSTFRQAYRNIDVLLMDDIHVFSRKGATQEEFFHTFNTLHLHGKQIILSANCSPQELELIEPRLVSRFEWGIVLAISPAKNEHLKDLLQNKADTFNYKLEPEVTEFLLETFTSNPKTLTKALEALILRSHLNQTTGANAPKGKAALNLAKQYLADLISEEERSSVTPNKIIQYVAELHGIPQEDILGKSQRRDCTLPRQIAMYLCRTKLALPFMKIGELFERDHSTVMTSVKYIQSCIDEGNADINSSLSKIEKKIQG